MAKTTGPLLSFSGSGQIGKTQVYGSWRGISYARRYVIPANPNTEAQQSTRGVFKWLQAVWKLLDPTIQAPWTAFSKGKPLTNRNSFSKSNLAGLRGTTGSPATTIDTFVASPGANGGLAYPTLVLADATGHVISATMTAPALPDGWAIVKGHAVALKEQDAATDAFYNSVSAFDATSPYVPSLSMGAAGEYVVSAFFEYTKPDGSTAFSPSITHTITIA